ncbi:MAG: discoidin domain-containing protein [Gammaproteobacteria bacterium]|nr:discoidin domain-containing protein [Gammaproteobacteria bacterium]
MKRLMPPVLAALLTMVMTTANAADSDSDGVSDAGDNCLLVANAAQQDSDGDNIGNACDADFNNDCVVDLQDLGFMRSVFLTGNAEADLDGDGSVSLADLAIMRGLFLGTPGPSGWFTACNSATELAATATSNSELQPASLAVDGNMFTRWETVHGLDPGILVLDLAQSYPLTRVEIFWEAANAGTYNIEGSNDNVSWDTLSTQTGGQFGDRTDIVDINGTYRYLRMNGLSRSPGNIYGYSIWEMDVFGDAGAGIEIDVDVDDDGVVDSVDLCPGSPPGATVDSSGCEIVVNMNEVAVVDGILTGGTGSAFPGYALYVLDNDLGTGGSTCNGGCATTWPPLLVADGSASGVPGLSTITRGDGTSQAAFEGRPLYFYSGDTAPGDINGQGLGGVWWLVEYIQQFLPLFDETTLLEPELQEDTPAALITRLADRARDRHAREAQFQAYDHYLSFYWEHRTAEIEIVDSVGRGGNTVTFNVTTEWPLSPTEAELRFFHLQAAVYADNGIMSAVPELDVPGETRRHYTRSAGFNPLTGSALQVGDRMEFELSQFLTGTPNGRDNYYGTAILYIVGQGVVPWEAQGAAQNSFPMPLAGMIGGDTTLNYQYSDEPDNHFLQMPTNLSNINGQVFVEGRRVHHTDFGDGSHNEAPENDGFIELAGLLGTNYINRSCVSCHAKNGRALPPAINQPLRQYVVRTGDDSGNPDPLTGAVLQPLSTSGSPEGSVTIASWTESNGLRSPNFAFTPGTPVNFSARIAPQLVGLGLLESIPETEIEAMADPDDVNGDGISGRMHLVTDPENGQTRLGRFGWKASQAKLKHQVAAALNTDVGVMTSLLPSPDCGSAQSGCGPAGGELADEYLEKLTAYIALLGVSARRDLDDTQALQGEALFNSSGCAACHAANLQTSPYHPHAELRDQTIHPYTDLLLHDMGPGLAATLAEGDASGAEWRTAPLWGIGLTAGVSGGEAYLHDGRARNLTEAILWHGGEAEASKQAFEGLSQSEKDALIAFLNSL